MKRQDTQNEIEFFNRTIKNGERYDTISEKVFELILDKIIPHIGTKILDAGCGSGVFGLGIKSKKSDVSIIGIDLNQNFVNLSLNTGAYDKTVCANIEQEDTFEESQFDTIVCPYLMHHFPDIQTVLDNCFNWLKPGGYIVIVDPNGSNLVLKVSYLLRFLLSKVINTSKYASINESHKSIPVFLKGLSKFEICSIETFEHKSKEKLRLFPITLINMLATSQKILMKIYKHIPFIKFGGSDLIIIAKKNEKF